MDGNEVWSSVSAELALTLSAGNFSTWIKPIEVGEFSTDGEKTKITLSCPSIYVKGMIVDKYQAQIVEAVERITGKETELSLTIGERAKTTTKKVLVEPPSPLFTPQDSPRAEIQHNLNPRLTMDTYVVGSSNNFAHAAALGVIKNPGRKYNPLFIYGGVGLGKTHLMHAIGHALLEANPRTRILYISAETFGNDLIASLQSKKIANFKKRYRSCDVLMVDDIQFISGKEYTQEEFFHTFNELHMSERQIILTSDRPPQEIPKIEERLSSRFLGGLTVDIQPPDYEMRVAILTQKSKEMQLDVSPQALAVIAEHMTTNARELEGNFRQIVAKAEAKNSALTPEFVSDFFGVVQTGRKLRLRPNTIITKTAQYFSYKTQELLGNSRKAPLVTARHVAMYLIKTELDVPLEQIGELFGGRDHTTIMHAVDKITAAISLDTSTGKSISDIKHTLLNAE